MGNLFLGIDIGTTGCKCVLYNIKGQAIASYNREYQIASPRPLWLEENPLDWWRAVISGIGFIVSSPGVDPKDIAGIAISCTNALVAVDKEGEPLRNAIILFDSRAIAQAKWIDENIGSERVFEIAGNQVVPGSFSAPFILWIKECEPDIFQRTYKFLAPTGYIVKKLTNQFSIDTSRASMTLFFDIKRQVWAEEISQEMGIPREKLPPLYKPWEIVGRVSLEAAYLTGLIEGTPIVAGCTDTVAATIGAGGIKSGESFLIVGSTGRICSCLDRPNFDPGFVNTCHGVPNLWLAIAAINGAGTSLRWFRDKFGHLEIELAKELDLSVYELLDREAATSNPGAGGIIYLPYIMAERSPIWDVDARAVLFGMGLSHTRGDIIRSILEGVAYAFRHNLEILEREIGQNITSLSIGGRGALSSLWRQVFADVLGKEILVPEVLETETLGDAILAGVGVGVYKEFESGVKETFRLKEKVKPRKEQEEIYRELFGLYKQLYLDLKGDFKRLSQIRYLTKNIDNN